MALAGSLHLSYDLGLFKNKGCYRHCKSPTSGGKLHCVGARLSSRVSLRLQDPLSLRLSENACRHSSHVRPTHYEPYRCTVLRCHCFQGPHPAAGLSGVNSFGASLIRSYNALQGNPVVVKVASAVGIIIFALWGLGPILRRSRNLVDNKSDGNWKKSSTYYIMTSYLQPLLLWSGALLLCRAVDPVVLPTEASQIVKQRLLNFIRSLSTVLAFSYCISGAIQPAQKFFMESSDPNNMRNMGFQFAGKAVYSAVWVAAVSLFMELLGFSTQRWLTAGGLGTVLLTLAGREIFTNFLSSMMIHATRPFILNEWIQTKIEGYDVSGHVEHIGWWSPTIIRGEDGEAVHIPNHKFTVSVVRNLSQKTHWRIKTHLAISHLDVSKISNIVADMRKVLAKNPQVEQQRLHRRVFLDYIDPENQALLILISCFVKTPHIQGYLGVKEAILMDLLRVIRHHGARLATPIRTVQKFYSDPDLEGVSYQDTSFSRGGMTSHRPLLLMESPYKVNGDDKVKSRTGRTTMEPDGKSPIKTAAENRKEVKSGAVASSESKDGDRLALDAKTDAKGGEVPTTASSNSDARSGESSTLKSPIAPLTNNDSTETVTSNSKKTDSVSANLTQKISDKKQPKKKSLENSLHGNKPVNPPVSSQETGSKEASESAVTSASKQQSEKSTAGQPATSKSSLEENIVLGVALEGSKRTLPIEEELPSTPANEKELNAIGNGGNTPTAETNKKDGQITDK